LIWDINLILKTITMLKNILELKGTQKLTKNEQKSIIGAKAPEGTPWGSCPEGYRQCVAWGGCVPYCL
jgi:hypothetical protein